MTSDAALPPFRIVLILCAMRTGSNLLCSMLRSVPGNAAFFEVFASHGIEGLQHLPDCQAALKPRLGIHDDTDGAFLAARNADPVGFFDALCAAARSVGYSSLSLKVLTDQLSPAHLDALLRRPHVSVLFLTRSRIARHISAVKGEILQNFLGVDTTGLQPTLSLAPFLQDAFDTDRILEGFHQQVRKSGVPHALLSYEYDLDIAHNARFARLGTALREIGVTADLSSAVTEDWIVKQDRATHWTAKIANGFEMETALAGLGLADYARDEPLRDVISTSSPHAALVLTPRNNSLLEESGYNNNIAYSVDPVITFSAIQYLRSYFTEWMIGPHPAFGTRRGLHFIKPTWTMEKPDLSAILTAIRQAEACNPGHIFVAMHVSDAEAARYRAHGVPSVPGNPNLFADESIVTCDADPHPDLPMSDAIYVARLEPWKRHELASKLIKPLFVYANPDSPVAEAQMQMLQQTCPTALFVNHQLGQGKYHYLKRPEMVRALASARVSLALSSVEGCMRASSEALFAGLPVVSIDSVGGRDIFYTPDTALIVDDTPEAVRDGVAEMLSRRLTRAEVRRATMARVKEERTRFLDAANRIVADHLGPLAPEIRMEPLLDFTVRYTPLSTMIEAIR